MKTSLEIAQEAELVPIDRIAERAGLEADEIEPYGRYKAKVALSVLDRLKDRPDGKVVCVTGMTPTRAGLTQVVPMEDLNLHFTGDIHAIGAANNLLAAMIDASILHGNPHHIDALRIPWRRAVDMNDRALRDIAVGLGGRANGYPRETGFDITAASEVMAIMAVARDLQDLRRRIGRVTAAYSFDGGKPITAEDLGAAGAMTVLLKDAIKPNLVQTLEGQPVLMHCGPFANIAHGNNSLIADLIGMKLGDYVVTESGFGADMGMEKFFDIVCRFGKLTPSAAVLVTTVRAIKHHAGLEDDPRAERSAALQAIETGFANVRRHLNTIATFGVPAVVAVNRRPGDTNEEIELVKRLALEAGAFAAEANEGFTKGGAGVADLASAVVEACEQPNTFHQIYQDDEPLQDKIEAVAKQVYGAKDVYFYPEAEAKLTQFTREGHGNFPVCMAKTHLSLSADPSLLNAPENFTLPVRDIRAYTGAGWLVPLCGDVMQMPGLGKTPAALNIDIDENGRTVGLF
jgi:formate--tetrahydrofolate ligase